MRSLIAALLVKGPERKVAKEIYSSWRVIVCKPCRPHAPLSQTNYPVWKLKTTVAVSHSPTTYAKL